VNLSNFSFFFPFLKEKRNHFCIDNYPLDRVVGYCQYFSLFLINVSSWDLLKLSWFRIVRKKKKKHLTYFASSSTLEHIGSPPRCLTSTQIICAKLYSKSDHATFHYKIIILFGRLSTLLLSFWIAYKKRNQ
jgi:hypothetical protein